MIRFPLKKSHELRVNVTKSSPLCSPKLLTKSPRSRMDLLTQFSGRNTTSAEFSVKILFANTECTMVYRFLQILLDRDAYAGNLFAGNICRLSSHGFYDSAESANACRSNRTYRCQEVLRYSFVTSKPEHECHAYWFATMPAIINLSAEYQRIRESSKLNGPI